MVLVGLGVAFVHAVMLWTFDMNTARNATTKPQFIAIFPAIQNHANQIATPPPIKNTTQKSARKTHRASSPSRAEFPPEDTSTGNEVILAPSSLTQSGEIVPAATVQLERHPSDSETPFRTKPRALVPSSSAAYLNNPPPDYPAISRRLSEQGKVVVRVLVGKDGNAKKSEVLESSGFQRLDQAALHAVMNWRFVPGEREGQVQDMWTNIPVIFTIK